MTIPEKILVAAGTIGEASFSAEDLVIRCWELFPDDFGLQGYSTKYPDSNRVLSKIMGASSPLRSNGWLRKVAAKRYRLTDAGRLQVAQLKSRDADGGASNQRLSGVTRASAATLKRLLASRAYAKFSQGEDALTFGDACELWNISPRSNASQLAARMAEVNSAIDAALKSTDAEQMILPGGTVATRSALATLAELSTELAARFRVELDVIRSRADERRQ